jgi:hypothetical protein
VVTARLRDEALQRVPMPVAALDALELQRAAHGPRDLGAVVPNITIHTARPRNNAVTARIRGAGQSEPMRGGRWPRSAGTWVTRPIASPAMTFHPHRHPHRLPRPAKDRIAVIDALLPIHRMPTASSTSQAI